MLLSELLPPAHIVVPLEARDKPAVLGQLTRLLVARVGGSYEDVLQAVEERERALSTGIGFGVAIPHGRAPTLPSVGLVCGVTTRPVPFDALDGEPVRLVFLLAGPESSSGTHVKVLSRIARLVRRDKVRETLIGAGSAEEFHRILVEAER